jgi:peptidyl-tRNA hydrolase
MAAAGALAAMGAAFNVQQSKQTETGYEKTSTVDGRLVTEEWNNDGNGKFGMMVKNRFMVQAEGKVASIDELKGAVAAVGLNRLEAMAN